jgi:queuine tRNA-ribosyltransferase
LGSTLATIHNLHFTVSLVDQMRESIHRGDFSDFKADFLGRYLSR